MSRWLLFALLISTVSLVEASDRVVPAAVERTVEFARDVQPILREHCFKCHGPNRQRGDFRLDLKSTAMKGGESFAPAIIPGQGAESPLVRVTAGVVDGMQMPPEGEASLTDEQIGILRAWIDQGAIWPADSQTSDSPQTHWSFEPVKRPRLPELTGTAQSWADNPIDAWISSALAARTPVDLTSNLPALSPSPPAERPTLIRRLSFDLLGLPPTPDEVMEFVQDPHDDAVERLVDRLLASPHFGERWARHWLDVVRFAESDGFETNQPRPNAWPYRDYVIRAFNEDKPIRQFLFEQLAGDTIGVDEGTGFLVGGAWDRVKSPDPVLTAQQRADELHDMVSTTGSALLGLTVGCARCHNHKFDPITQADYYSIKAVFAGVQHGERPLRPADFPQRQQMIESIQQRLAAISAELNQFEPLCHVVDVRAPGASSPRYVPATILLDDEPKPGPAGNTSVTFLVPRIGLQPYEPGTAKGHHDDPGDEDRFANLGRNYSYWNDVARTDLFTWNPGASGTWQVWISWGCGWDTHASDATYLIDHDGDLATVADQEVIARVDQRKFADGTGGTENQPLWSGFYDAGSHSLTPSARLVLRGGESAAYVTADLLCLQRVTPGATPPRQPQLRSAVQRQANVERIRPIRARYLRFTVESTTGGSPCLDELEVFTTAASGAKNVALASQGTRATSSSNLPGFDIHQLAFVNDGRYGNSASWISNEPDRGWVQLEFPSAVEIDRIVWSRDRPENGRYEDRIATRYQIEAGLNPDALMVVAASDDRVHVDRRTVSMSAFRELSSTERQQARQLADRRNELQQKLQSLAVQAKVYAGQFTAPEPTFRLHRGDPMQPKEPAAPAGLASFGLDWRLPLDASDTERRRRLADWIVSNEHPLTQRVMVNRFWHFHFGQGLVTTPSDFGRNGATPSHPQLLDWLASESASSESPKRLHRWIVTSATYRQSSDTRPAALQADAGTRSLWRYPPRRLEAEPIRDALLSISGNLDTRMYGAGFDLFEPNTNYVKVYQSKREFGPAEWRRMVYQTKPRMQLDEIFGQFDCPDAGQINPKRTSSITALQALNLLNSSFIVSQSKLFAQRLQDEAGSHPEAQVRRAFLLAFQREPLPAEVSGALELIRQHQLPAFCRALFNANEFLFVF